MSVTRDRQSTIEETDDWDDLEHQEIQISHLIDLTGGSGTDLPADGNSGSTFFNVSPTGDDLDRNEVAELVALDLIGYAVYFENVDILTTPGTVRGTGEVYRSPRSFDTTDISSSAVAHSGDAAEADVSVNSVQQVAGGRHSMAQFQSVTTAGFHDNASGTGGGGSIGQATPRFYSYREMFGNGPLFYPDQTVKFGNFVQWRTVDNAFIRVACQLKMIWEMWELEGQEIVRKD